MRIDDADAGAGTSSKKRTPTPWRMSYSDVVDGTELSFSQYRAVCDEGRYGLTVGGMGEMRPCEMERWLDGIHKAHTE